MSIFGNSQFIHRLEFWRFLILWYISSIMISPKRERRIKFLMRKKVDADFKEKTKDILKPKPRFLPKWLWKLLIYKLLDI